MRCAAPCTALRLHCARVSQRSRGCVCIAAAGSAVSAQPAVAAARDSPCGRMDASHPARTCAQRLPSLRRSITDGEKRVSNRRGPCWATAPPGTWGAASRPSAPCAGASLLWWWLLGMPEAWHVRRRRRRAPSPHTSCQPWWRERPADLATSAVFPPPPGAWGRAQRRAPSCQRCGNGRGLVVISTHTGRCVHRRTPWPSTAQESA